MSESENVDLGGLIADAAESQDADLVLNIMRSGDFIVLQQIDFETGEVEQDEEGNFSVVLAEVDEETAVVCFSTEECASVFVNEVLQDIPEGQELPSIVLDGESLLAGLPQDCGLLLNPGSDNECYFPPGSLDISGELEDEEE